MKLKALLLSLLLPLVKKYIIKDMLKILIFSILIFPFVTNADFLDDIQDTVETSIIDFKNSAADIIDSAGGKIKNTTNEVTDFTKDKWKDLTKEDQKKDPDRWIHMSCEANYFKKVIDDVIDTEVSDSFWRLDKVNNDILHHVDFSYYKGGKKVKSQLIHKQSMSASGDDNKWIGEGEGYFNSKEKFTIDFNNSIASVYHAQVTFEHFIPADKSMPKYKEKTVYDCIKKFDQ